MQQPNEFDAIIDEIRTKHSDYAYIADTLSKLRLYPGAAWLYLYEKSEVASLKKIFQPIINQRFANTPATQIKELTNTNGFFGLRGNNLGEWRNYLVGKIEKRILLLPEAFDVTSLNKVKNASDFYTISSALLECCECSKWDKEITHTFAEVLGLTKENADQILQNFTTDETRLAEFRMIIDALAVRTLTVKTALEKINRYFTQHGEKAVTFQVNGLRQDQARCIQKVAAESSDYTTLVTQLLNYECSIPRNSLLSTCVFEAIASICDIRNYKESASLTREYWRDGVLLKDKLHNATLIKAILADPYLRELCQYIESQKGGYTNAKAIQANKLANNLISCLLANPNNLSAGYAKFVFENSAKASFFDDRSRVTALFEKIQKASVSDEHQHPIGVEKISAAAAKK